MYKQTRFTVYTVHERGIGQGISIALVLFDGLH